jgi:hypothetical protein
MYPQALSALEESAAVNPRNATTLAHLALTYLRSYDGAKAAAVLARAGELHADVPELKEAQQQLAAFQR